MLLPNFFDLVLVIIHTWNDIAIYYKSNKLEIKIKRKDQNLKARLKFERVTIIFLP